MEKTTDDIPVDYSKSKFSIEFLLEHTNNGFHNSHSRMNAEREREKSRSSSPESLECDEGRSHHPGTDGERRKRPRTAFTATQIKTLESEFEKNKYLSVAKRVELSKLLGLSQQQLKVWYQNRRTKWKRKYANDLETMAQQYYASLGMTASRPMLIGDRLWIFNSPQDVPLNLRRNAMESTSSASGQPVFPHSYLLPSSASASASARPLSNHTFTPLTAVPLPAFSALPNNLKSQSPTIKE